MNIYSKETYKDKRGNDMTKEEAIFCEKSYIGETNCTDCKYYITDTCLSRESHKMAIKALEQVSILDEIRAEIVELRSEQNVGVLECLDIIDKHKEGSEVEEWS